MKENLTHKNAYAKLQNVVPDNQNGGRMKKQPQETMTFHDYQLEINRLEAKERRQYHTLERTRRLIHALRNLQKDGEPS